MIIRPRRTSTMCKSLKTTKLSCNHRLVPWTTRVLVTAVPYSLTASHVISRAFSVGLLFTVNTDTSSPCSSISNSSLGTISTPFSYQRIVGFGVPLTLTTSRLTVSSSSSSHIVSVCRSVSKYGDFPVSSGFFVSSTTSSSSKNKKKREITK